MDLASLIHLGADFTSFGQIRGRQGPRIMHVACAWGDMGRRLRYHLSACERHSCAPPNLCSSATAERYERRLPAKSEPSIVSVTPVTAPRKHCAYLPLIEHGDTHMSTTINTKLASLALAAALLLPGALAALNQAAQIVA